MTFEGARMSGVTTGAPGCARRLCRPESLPGRPLRHAKATTTQGQEKAG